MSRYRQVDIRVWNDEKFRQLSDYGKLCFFFVLTNPDMTALGAMRASVPGLAAEIGWTEKIFRSAFNEIAQKDMIRHDEKASFVWLLNFLKYNRPQSPNVVKAWKQALDLLPECNLKIELMERVKDFAESLPKAFCAALPEEFYQAAKIQGPKRPPKDDAARHSGAKVEKKKIKFQPDEVPYDLALILFESIRKSNPESRMHSYSASEKEATLQRWAIDIDLLLHKDLRKRSMIEAVIKFSTHDDFWKGNILSGKKLREKWDTLVHQMSRKTPKDAEQSAPTDAAGRQLKYVT